jgi:hypothetical protein
MSEQLNPQSIIDELIKRVNALTLENVVLGAQLQDHRNHHASSQAIAKDDVISEE